MEKLVARRVFDQDLFSAVHDSYYYKEEKEARFTSEQGFNVAITLEGQDVPIDPEIGNLIFYKSEWGYHNDDTEYFYRRTEL